MNFIAELKLAGNKVHMVIVQRGTGKHGPMRVESCASDWRRPVVVKEARVGLECGQVGTVYIESLDFVAVGSPVLCVSSGFEYQEGRVIDSHAEHRSMFVNTQGP
jgi:hypothetical protein